MFYCLRIYDAVVKPDADSERERTRVCSCRRALRGERQSARTAMRTNSLALPKKARVAEDHADTPHYAETGFKRDRRWRGYPWCKHLPYYDQSTGKIRTERLLFHALFQRSPQVTAKVHGLSGHQCNQASGCKWRHLQMMCCQYKQYMMDATLKIFVQ